MAALDANRRAFEPSASDTSNTARTPERSGATDACATATVSFSPTVSPSAAGTALRRSAPPTGKTPNAESAIVPAASPVQSTVSRAGGSKWSMRARDAAEAEAAEAEAEAEAAARGASRARGPNPSPATGRTNRAAALWYAQLERAASEAGASCQCNVVTAAACGRETRRTSPSST